MRTRGTWLHTPVSTTSTRMTPWILRVPHARTVSTHSHRAVELPAHVAVRRTHVGYSGYSRYCEYLQEIPEYRKSMPSALAAENLKRMRHGLPPAREATHPEAGAGPHVARYPDRYPARHGGTVRYSEYPRASAAGPVPLDAAGERAARQRSAGVSTRAPSAECALGGPGALGTGRSGGRVIDPAHSCSGRTRYSLSVLSAPHMGTHTE
jgi:hypothetical protein